jgi:ribonucleotide reductase beta subunit family protein with ferritin-like domain
MVFDNYFKTTEKMRWKLEDDIPWKSIDLKKARKQTEIIKILRDATLIESYAPISHMRMLQVHWDDIEVSGVLSIQLFEEYKHYHVLKKYLDAIGEIISEEEILEKRHKNKDAPPDDSDPVVQLAKYFMSEHFTGHFYVGLVAKAKDPVLKKILKLIAGDEFRHSQLYYDLLKTKLAKDPSQASKVLEFALHFEHFGAEVVDEVPISQKNDFKAIVGFARKIEQLCGKSPQEYIREKMERAN